MKKKQTNKTVFSTFIKDSHNFLIQCFKINFKLVVCGNGANVQKHPVNVDCINTS